MILERISTAVSATLRKEKAGFRAGRSCTDQIANLCTIIEQSLEWQSPLYVNFVDYKMAFDMVDWTDTSCRVIHNTDLSHPLRSTSETHARQNRETEQRRQTTGFEISVGKTKSLRVNATQEAPINIDRQAIEDVDHFTYLQSARQEELMKIPVWRNENISLHTKLRLFNTNVKSVLLYGSETWRRTKSLDYKLQVFIKICLRQILRIRWPERMSNEELMRRTKQDQIKKEYPDEEVVLGWTHTA
ncbi:uncharacterized protein LOC143280308 [Babylonia areolata]|uniref:uncharacterized protein LOC143280308 n=1 Tax=Babylonia areolata TaxID=304850 RepID=UPI003FCF1880